jgi:hypothetical protein
MSRKKKDMRARQTVLISLNRVDFTKNVGRLISKKKNNSNFVFVTEMRITPFPRPSFLFLRMKKATGGQAKNKTGTMANTKY